MRGGRPRMLVGLGLGLLLLLLLLMVLMVMMMVLMLLMVMMLIEWGSRSRRQPGRCCCLMGTTHRRLVLIGQRLGCGHRGFLGLGLLFLFVQLFDGLNFLLQFHTSILEPDLDLAFGEAESVSHFDASPPGQVMIRVEFLFQLQGLVAGVGLAPASSEAICT